MITDAHCLGTSNATIDHHDFTQNSIAVNPEGGYFDLAVSHTALFHATLALVALHLNLTKYSSAAQHAGTTYEQEVFHQASAVHEIHQHLAGSITSQSDHLITAVSILANFEVRML